MQYYKRYVDVDVWMGKDGQLIPKVIYWQNIGYPIDQIIKIRESYSIVGGGGILYECLIQKQKRHLFYERNRWFIESTKP